MATATDSTGFCAGTKERLRNLFDELGLADLLELDEPWTVRDCERDQVEMAQNLNKLLALEVVEVVGEEEVKWDGQTQFDAINQYEFDDRARELLEESATNSPVAVTRTSTGARTACLGVGTATT